MDGKTYKIEARKKSHRICDEIFIIISKYDVIDVCQVSDLQIY